MFWREEKKILGQEMRGEFHKIWFQLLHHSLIDRYLKSSYYMQDAGNVTANTINKFLIDVEFIFPWIFQSKNQEDWWLIKCRLVRNTRTCRPHRFSFLPLQSQHIPFSTHYFSTTWTNFLYQTHQAQFLLRAWLLLLSTRNALPSDPRKTHYSQHSSHRLSKAFLG